MHDLSLRSRLSPGAFNHFLLYFTRAVNWAARSSGKSPKARWLPKKQRSKEANICFFGSLLLWIFASLLLCFFGVSGFCHWGVTNKMSYCRHRNRQRSHHLLQRRRLLALVLPQLQMQWPVVPTGRSWHAGSRPGAHQAAATHSAVAVTRPPTIHDASSDGSSNRPAHNLALPWSALGRSSTHVR